VCSTSRRDDDDAIAMASGAARGAFAQALSKMQSPDKGARRPTTTTRRRD